MRSFRVLRACVQRPAACRAAQRLDQHPVKPQITGRAELLDADGHAFVARLRLRPVGAQKPIPPRQPDVNQSQGRTSGGIRARRPRAFRTRSADAAGADRTGRAQSGKRSLAPTVGLA